MPDRGRLPTRSGAARVTAPISRVTPATVTWRLPAGARMGVGNGRGVMVGRAADRVAADCRAVGAASAAAGAGGRGSRPDAPDGGASARGAAPGVFRVGADGGAAIAAAAGVGAGK